MLRQKKLYFFARLNHGVELKWANTCLDLLQSFLQEISLRTGSNGMNFENDPIRVRIAEPNLVDEALFKRNDKTS